MEAGRKKNQVCPLCGKTSSKIFFELTNMPCSCNLLWSSKEKAIDCPKGDITLGFCPSCTFIANYSLDFEKNQYTDQYDNALFYSALFQDYAKKMVLDLVDKYDLHHKTVMEVTVGKVDFLPFFCTLGPNRGIKFYTSLINSKQKNQNNINSSTFSLTGNDHLFENEVKTIDFVFSYHELEHVNSPKCLLNILKETVGTDSNAIFYFLIPNISKTFNDGDFTNIIYEHPSYFTAPSIFYLFTSCGYNVIDIVEEADNAYSASISVIASLSKKTKTTINPKFNTQYIETSVSVFGIKTKLIIEKMMDKLTQLLDQGKRIVVWGAGARGVTFLNIFRDERITYAVDINPKKQGNFVPGTGQKIVNPEFLVQYRPDFVIVTNTFYQEEVKQTLDKLNLKSQILIFIS